MFTQKENKLINLDNYLLLWTLAYPGLCMAPEVLCSAVKDWVGKRQGRGRVSIEGEAHASFFLIEKA